MPMRRLVLLHTPAHAAGEIARLMKVVREDRMPLDDTGSEQPLQLPVQYPRDGTPGGLGGPAGEVGAVVGDVQPKTTEPAVRGDGGLGRARVDQDSSSCCDGGSENPAASAASAVANHTSATVRL